MTLKEQYQSVVVPALKKDFGIESAMAVPKLKSVTISVGLSQGIKDPKVLETVERTLERISGQKPAKTKAKKSISSFKIREGMVVGMMVTLRGQRMWDFLTRLTNFTFPRIRDFRGISSKSMDAHGNLSLGFRENIAFPEIRPDEIERIHGLQITIATTAGERTVGTALLKGLGFPFTN